MQGGGLSHERNIRLSTRLSVCLFVCQTRELAKKQKKRIPKFLYPENVPSSSFLTRRTAGEGDSFYLKF